MAWTTPASWTTSEVVTAAKMNTQVRDNFLETAPGKVTTAGDLIHGTGANALARLASPASPALLATTGTGSAPAWRGFAIDERTGSTSISDTTYGDVAVGTAVAVTITTGTRALVHWGAQLAHDTAGTRLFISYRISGATTLAASDNRAINYESSNANDIAEFGRTHLVSVTAGSNTFTLQRRVGTATGLGTYAKPWILVQAL